MTFMRTELGKANVNFYELSIVNVNFMRAGHWEGKFIRAELCECELYES